jgi:hypothetical protein
MTDLDAHDPAARSDLREQVRQGTLRRMERALVDAKATIRGLVDGGCPPGDERVREAALARDRLVASIQEVTG